MTPRIYFTFQVTGVLIQERPVSSAPSPPPQGSIDVKIEIATHRDMSKEKGFKPRLTLQVLPHFLAALPKSPSNITHLWNPLYFHKT